MAVNLQGAMFRGFFLQAQKNKYSSAIAKWKFYGHYRYVFNHCDVRNWPAKQSNSVRNIYVIFYILFQEPGAGGVVVTSQNSPLYSDAVYVLFGFVHKMTRRPTSTLKL